MKFKNSVYLGIGSNLNKEKTIQSCLNYLSASFNKIQISPIYQSASYGFEGNDFYNLVVKIEHCDIIYPSKTVFLRCVPNSK